ncbi:MAG TPA: type II toxin-antitoxin system Phd/YefM family antitoxin [Verrucomicrobiales bacterium]|jgi:antitoxin (DNA-binding transcriptional repressor) of toxin-antitoxin stability system|nr:type II toxin-antitoxin system Phd/YefM family antitoxin [Verrucomicrobiales bacterium]HIL25233.1 type II toxin-antitoxin system Phd/YefM family antitoxin [Verrucomicrobiota bacterium]
MKEVGLYEAKTQLSALVNSLGDSGEGIALTRHGKVVAELHPPSGKAPKRGCLKSAKFRMAKDFDADALGFEDFFGEPSAALQVAEPKRGYKTKRGKGK